MIEESQLEKDQRKVHFSVEKMNIDEKHIKYS